MVIKPFIGAFLRSFSGHFYSLLLIDWCIAKMNHIVILYLQEEKRLSRFGSGAFYDAVSDGQVHIWKTSPFMIVDFMKLVAWNYRELHKYPVQIHKICFVQSEGCRS